jgi:glyoxylase-like metal-dependent hydrolase (beta-lactamase superfamily II)
VSFSTAGRYWRRDDSGEQERRVMADAELTRLMVPPPFDKPVTIAPGILWLRVRLPFALDHVNLWLIEGEDGWTLVDTGVGNAATRAVWERVLTTTLRGRLVARLLVTHFHPDHFGLAAWLVERTGAPLLMSRIEWLTGRMLSLDNSADALAAADAHYVRAGMSDEVRAAQAERGHGYRRSVPATPAIHHVIEAGQTLVLGDAGWEVIVGEGHAPEQVTIYSSARNLLISADQILPRISPVVGVWSSSPEADPLGEFLRSLERYKHLPPDTHVLPSHDAPFIGLHTRIGELARHHDERLELALEAARAPATAADVLRTLFPRRYDPHQMGFALAETLAHLNHLLRRGEVERGLDEEGRWRFVRR